MLKAPMFNKAAAPPRMELLDSERERLEAARADVQLKERALKRAKAQGRPEAEWRMLHTEMVCAMRHRNQVEDEIRAEVRARMIPVELS